MSDHDSIIYLQEQLAASTERVSYMENEVEFWNRRYKEQQSRNEDLINCCRAIVEHPHFDSQPMGEFGIRLDNMRMELEALSARQEESVKRGIEQAERGELKDLGSFAEPKATFRPDNHIVGKVYDLVNVFKANIRRWRIFD